MKVIRTRFAALVDNPTLAELESSQSKLIRLESALAILERFRGSLPDSSTLSRVLANGTSQIGQDFFALAANEFRIGGTFCEFGAGDGVQNSNSFVLESQFQWLGLLGEPNRQYWEPIRSKRKATLDTRAVWSSSGEDLDFIQAHELSALNVFAELDSHRHARVNSRQTMAKVHSVSLLDLLVENEAPRKIDFLSVDTEGSELEILAAFDFTRYQFGAICVEHNWNKNELEIEELFKRHGYVRVLRDISQFDAWFIPSVNSCLFAN